MTETKQVQHTPGIAHAAAVLRKCGCEDCRAVADSHADLLAALEDALRSAETDGPNACAASVYTLGRAAIRKARQS